MRRCEPAPAREPLYENEVTHSIANVARNICDKMLRTGL